MAEADVPQDRALLGGAERAISCALVLVVAEPPPIFGQSIATSLLLRALDGRRIEYRKLNTNRSFHGTWGVIGYGHRLLRVALLPLELARIGRHLRGRRVVFYMQLGHRVRTMVRDWALLALARRHGWATVFHVHGGGFRESLDRSPLLLRRSVARVLGDARRVVVLSSGLRSMFHGLVEDSRIAVIPNGVEECVAVAAALRRRGVGSAPGLNVLFLSNLMEEKGYREFLELAEASERLGLPHEFTVAGERTETTTVNPGRVIATAGLRRTRYVGSVSGETKNRLLSQADVLVLPTRALEGQPIVILEAMHHGLAIVTTAQGGLKELVTDRVNGLIVPPRDARALLVALQTLSDDRGLLRAFSRHNRAVAKKRFTERTHGEAMVRLLLEVEAEVADDRRHR